ncbi:MAG: hypothetical protein L0Y79_11380 [Chlorobi bacterium]|nr:hypothetical protein [Chlorobiota bacterium]MCI0714747.1 hypothetical protein [Chlorobiota bacterium]
MNNTKLVDVLKTFTKAEFKEFEKLVASPFFNRGRNYLPFLKELKKFYPKFDDDKLTYEYMHSKIYLGKKFNKQIIWNMNSALYNMAEEFLIQVTLKKNSFTRNNHIEDELYYRKLSNLCSQKLDTMEQNLKSIGLGSNYFLHKIQLEICKMNLLFLEDRQHLVPGHVLKEGESAVIYFLIIMANVINNIYYNILLFNTKFDINIPFEFIKSLNLDIVIDYAKTNKFKYANILELYYCIIMTALKPNEFKYFQKAKELYEKSSHYLESGERGILLGVLCNYSIYRANKGEDYFKKMLFEVNLLMLKESERLQKKEIGKIFYIQAIRNALQINEIDWSKKFIEKYTPYLKNSYQKPMRALAESFIAFKQDDYNKVIENLTKVRFIDTRDKFYVKSLSIMAYYELNEILVLLYNIDSAKQFVIKNPSLGRLTSINFNKFLNALKKLIDIKEKSNLKELKNLYVEIEQEKSMVNYDWLLEKIDEIKTNKR